MRKSVVRVLVGLSCLPSATRLNVREPAKSSAFSPTQYSYVLESTDPEDLKGGPARVVLTSFDPLVWNDEELMVGEDIKTKHFSDKKNLPSRKIIGIRNPGGEIFGEVPVGSLPHWELMDGFTTAQDLQSRIDANVAVRNLPKEKKATKTV